MTRLTTVRLGASTLTLALADGVHHDPLNEPLYAALAGAVRPGDRVLDLGCGNGVLGLVAARAGASHVTFVDVDPNAVALALDNAARDGLTRCDGAAGDLVAPVRGREFDLVVFNPPQTGGPPALAVARPDRYGGEDGAWHFTRFATEAHLVLPALGARCVYHHVSRANPRRVAAAFVEAGFTSRTLAEQDRRFSLADLEALAAGTGAHQLALRAAGAAEFEGPDEGGRCALRQSVRLATRTVNR